MMAADHPARGTLAVRRNSSLNPTDAATIASVVADAKRLGAAAAANMPNKDANISSLGNSSKQGTAVNANVKMPDKRKTLSFTCGLIRKDGERVTVGEAKRRVVASKHIVTHLHKKPFMLTKDEIIVLLEDEGLRVVMSDEKKKEVQSAASSDKNYYFETVEKARTGCKENGREIKKEDFLGNHLWSETDEQSAVNNLVMHRRSGFLGAVGCIGNPRELLCGADSQGYIFMRNGGIVVKESCLGKMKNISEEDRPQMSPDEYLDSYRFAEDCQHAREANEAADMPPCISSIHGEYLQLTSKSSSMCFRLHPWMIAAMIGDTENAHHILRCQIDANGFVAMAFKPDGTSGPKSVKKV